MSQPLIKDSRRVFGHRSLRDTRIKKTGPQAPMTKGQALIRARSILGPNGWVNQVLDEFPCVFVAKPNGEYFLVSTGPDWESAIAGAAVSDRAMEWQDRQIELDNETGMSIDSLKQARQAKGEQNQQKFLQSLVDMWNTRDENKVKHAEEYVLWKESRQEAYDNSLRYSKELAAMSPDERESAIDLDAAVQKVKRIKAYVALGETS